MADRANVMSVVLHELRTPLTSVASLIGMIEDGSLCAGDRAEAMTAVRRNTERMLALVDDLHLLADLESGAPVRHAPVPLRELFPELPEGPCVSGDPGLLAMLVRLMTGVVSAVAADGVTVAAGYGSDGWTLSARGYTAGLGTDEELLTAGLPAGPELPYRRSVALSVLLAQAIAASHGGTSSFEREPDGQAVVTVRLPA